MARQLETTRGAAIDFTEETQLLGPRLVGVMFWNDLG